MLTPRFVPATPAAHRAALLELNLEYATWVATEIETAVGINTQALIGMPLAAYIDSILDTICGDTPPRGIFYLVMIDEHLAGMGGVRCLSLSNLYGKLDGRGRTAALARARALGLLP